MTDANTIPKIRPIDLPKPGPRQPLSKQAPVGSVFGHWTVVEHLPARHGHRYLRCQCVCGAIRDVMGGHIVRGKSTNCGCKHSRDGNRTHGLSDTRTHIIWMNMLDRCRRPNNKNFHQYGGRGISVCQRWDRFENFLADMGEAPKGLTLDRIDNDGNYEPGNCRWATKKEQCNNKRTTVTMTLDGLTMRLEQWATVKGLTLAAIYHRRCRGWTDEQVLLTPQGGRRRG